MTGDGGDTPTLGAFLRARRRALGLSQARVAALAGRDRRALSRLESGRHHPHAATLARLAAVLDIPAHTMERLPPEPRR